MPVQSSRPFGLLSGQDIFHLIGEKRGFGITDPDEFFPAAFANSSVDFRVTDELVAVLQKNGFQIHSLSASPQEQQELRLRVCVLLRLGVEGADLRFHLNPQGPAVIPRSDDLGHASMGALLIGQRLRSGSSFSDVIGELVRSGGSLRIPFAEAGLAGIEPIKQVFQGHFHRHPAILRLAQSDLSPLDPSPYGKVALHVLPNQRARLLKLWECQILAYRNSLAF